MRYFFTLAYLGKRFCGWQRQPNGLSVQEVLEEAIGSIIDERVEVTGCGRTDAGVHARLYVAHCDIARSLPETFLTGLNSRLPAEIAVYDVAPVPDSAHARYSAFERSYEYHISLRKDPFHTGTTWFFRQGRRLELEKMQAVAAVLPDYTAFFPFCKTDSGVDSYRCTLRAATWRHDAEAGRMVFSITANRFLRGMVRLIVGACINAGLGKLDVETVRAALDQQKVLAYSLSVPPHGLFLTDVKYPDFYRPPGILPAG